jgi:hypothetical protein
MFYTINKHYTKLSYACFIQNFLSSKNNKKLPIKALELDIRILLQNMHDIYFSCKTHHKRRLTKLEPYFFDKYSIYYAFSKIIAITRIK